ncbi:pyridoxal-phosphate dependent enzyme, partial [Fusobacterium sp.]
RAGELTCKIISEYVDDIVSVTEDELAQSILFLLERSKVLAEGAGAAPLAALLSGKIKEKGKNICCVISGGNADITAVERIINKALILAGRKTEINVLVEDRFGELHKLLAILAQEKASILRINQTMYSANLPINTQKVTVAIECMDKNHRDKIIETIKEAGFQMA